MPQQQASDPRGDVAQRSPSIVIDDVRLESGRDGHQLSATVRTKGRPPSSIWFRTSDVPLTHRADPFLPIGLIAAMRAGRDLHIDGVVSPCQLAACETIQRVFANWYPDRMHRIRVTAATAEPASAAAAPAGRGLFFSLGADSLYAAIALRDTVTHLITVRGFDIPRSDEALWNTVAAHARDAAARLGQRLILVDTTAREFMTEFSPNWALEGFGAALAGVALACQPELREAHIASEIPYRYLRPHASHPVIDPLWSNERLAVVHAIADIDKPNRIRALAASDVAMDHLRVCWENPAGAYNCGRCTKCLRAMAQLEAVGALERCRTFPKRRLGPIDLWKIATLDHPLELIEIQARLFRDFTLTHSKDWRLRLAARACASPARLWLTRALGRAPNRVRRAPGWFIRRWRRPTTSAP